MCSEKREWDYEVFGKLVERLFNAVEGKSPCFGCRIGMAWQRWYARTFKV